MSSARVRTAIKNFLTDKAPTENVIDLSGEYLQMDVLMEKYGLDIDSKWLGLQFVGDLEEPVALAANNTEGSYREYGAVFFHVVAPAEIGVGDAMVARADAIRKELRGQNLEGVNIDTVTPPNTESGAALQFDSGFMSATFMASYYIDIDPGT